MLGDGAWEGRGRDVRIFVKSLTGRKMLVTVALEGSAFRLKQLLATTATVPISYFAPESLGGGRVTGRVTVGVDDIRLVYSGKQLADDKPLEFYNIQAGGTIHMVLQLRGGGGAP